MEILRKGPEYVKTILSVVPSQHRIFIDVFNNNPPVLFNKKPTYCIVNDQSNKYVNMYEQVRDAPDEFFEILLSYVKKGLFPIKNKKRLMAFKKAYKNETKLHEAIHTYVSVHTCILRDKVDGLLGNSWQVSSYSVKNGVNLGNSTIIDKVLLDFDKIIHYMNSIIWENKDPLYVINKSQAYSKRDPKNCPILYCNPKASYKKHEEFLEDIKKSSIRTMVHIDFDSDLYWEELSKLKDWHCVDLKQGCVWINYTPQAILL